MDAKTLKMLESYECDEQINIEEWLWDSGYYMPLPEVEDEGEELSLQGM